MIIKVHPNEQAIREELARVLASRAFGPKSPIHHLLTWLVERALADSEATLKEYTIGVEAFGRPEGYDPQQDAYVRVQAARLRQRLQEYYGTEGVDDPIRIELPKRQYLLEFHPQPPEPVPSHPQPPAPAPGFTAPQTRRSSSRLQLSLCAVLLVWAAVATAMALWPRQSGLQRVSPELATIWGPFLTGSRPVLISLGTHQFYAHKGGFLREPGLDHAVPEVRAKRIEELAAALGGGPLRPHQGYTGTGQATGAFLLGRFFGAAGPSVQLIRSSALNWDGIAGHNVIFLGSAKSNPQIRSIPFDWSFQIDGPRVINLKPQAREPAAWANALPDARSESDEFALISFVNGLHSSGKILIIEGVTTAGIWAAAMYLTDPGYAQDLVAKLTADGSRPMPDQYQAVLRVFVRDAVPLRVRYETHRSW